MTRDELEAELGWRLKAQAEMVGTLYPAINAARMELLEGRLRELAAKGGCDEPVR
jgi:hypothetical protein